jgi:hypothetical protein
MGKNNLRKPLGQTIWIKVVLTILVFLPPITEISYNSMNTTDVIASVLSNPAIVSIPVLLPVAKLILLICVVMTIIADRFSARALLGYYCIILLFVSIFQNMAVSKDYGFAWLPGNTLVQFFVLSYCLYDLLRNKTQIKKTNY